jgi:hypothetical protein
MRTVLFASLLAACTSPGPTTTDNPIAVAVDGNHIVVAADEATADTGFGCGGGEAFLGSSVLFVSDNGGQTFARTVPADTRPLIRIAAHDGVFYAVAHDNSGLFAVVTSADGVTWTEVANEPDYAQDFAAASDQLVVAHATGVLTSADGSVWTNHEIAGDGYFRPSIARAHGMIVLGASTDGTLHVSSDAVTWQDRAIPGLSGIAQILATDDALLVAGHTDSGSAIARVDLADTTATPVVYPTTYSSFALVTTAGLLDNSGTLASVGPNGIGQGVAHVDPFVTGAVDGSTVALVRASSVTVSNDGGVTFGASVALPIVSN